VAEHRRSNLTGALALGRDGGIRALIGISAYDHVGLRVTDRTRSITFYEGLGFRLDSEWSDERVAELVCKDVRINLIFNGTPRPGGDNILLDNEVRWPGYTHAAFVVTRLADVLAWAEQTGTAITEGPVDWGRRITCFLRDPDGNVLEFNELVGPRESSGA